MAQKTISIGFKIEEGENGFQKLSLDATALKKAMTGTVQEAKTLSDKIKDFGAVNIGINALTESVSAMIDVFKEWSDAYDVQIEAETKLETVMRQRMKSTQEDIQGIKDLCSAQQQLGVVGDEVQLAGVQQIATYIYEKEALAELIPAMNNLVAQQRGLNATAGDCISIANLMGKAMMGNTPALREVGITFSEAEEKAVKYGTEVERAAALAKIITNNVGEMNSALAATDGGKIKQLENNIGDLKEKVGGLVKGMMPALTAINQFVMFGSNIGKVVNLINAVPGAFANMISSARQASLSINVLGKTFEATSVSAKAMAIAFKGAMMVMKTALITTGVGVAVWAIGEALKWVIEKLNGVEASAGSASNGLNGLSSSGEALKQKIEEATSSFSRHMEIAKNFNGSKQEEKKLVDELNGAYGESLGRYDSIAQWQKVLTENGQAYIDILVLQAEAEQLINDIIAKRKTKTQLENTRYFDEKTKPDPLGQQTYQGLKIKPTGQVIREAGLKMLDAQIKADTDKYLENQKDLAKRTADLAAKAKQSGSKGTSGKGGATARKEPPAPEGSEKALQDKISNLQKQYEITVNIKDKLKIQAEIESLRSLLDDMRFTVRFERFNPEGVLKEAEETLQKRPLTLDAGLKPEQLKESLPKEIAPIASTVGNAFEETAKKNEALVKSMKSGASLASSFGSALSSLGDATDDPQAKVAGIVAATIANIMGSFASALAQSSAMGPFGWAAFGVAGLAQALAMVQQVKSVTAFANGGIVSGPTMALVGEYAGASNNPEVIAPLNKLRDLLPEPGAGVQHVVVEGRIKGSDIELVTGNRRRVASVSGRKY